jgi:2-amino-4-hydroxy-6-hydroxymethyldihydropteridine diphosphokinase
MNEMDKLVVVALGSNLGESEATLPAAMDRLDVLIGTAGLRSSLWRSSPVDCPSGSPDFVNAVVAFAAGSIVEADEFLEELQNIEREFGRTAKRVMNEARPLDLDLIAFKSEQRDSERLTLPHPRAHLRRFVLAPLTEILPGFQAPGWGMTAREYLRDLAGGEIVTRVGG